jgi:RND family efflux transporter MFP subunit
MKKTTIILVFMLLISSILFGCKKETIQKTSEEKAVRVKTTQAKKQDIALKTTLSGKLKPIEESEISPKLSGKIIKVHVKIGDKVKKGDVLFELDQKDLQNAVNQAEAAYQVAEANSKMTQEKVENARLNLERMKTLYEEGAVPKQQLEQFELQASETNLEVVRAQINQARVAVEDAKSRLSDTIVTAPITGFITSIDINEGEMATTGMKALSITDISKVLVETNISEYLINKVHIGDEVEVLIKSARKAPFKGIIKTLLPAPEKDSLTYPIEIEMKNADFILKPGMFAEIDIVSDKKKNVIAIPSDSVVLKEGDTTVAVVKEGRAKLKRVSLGIDNGELVEIKKGLKEGEVVVVKGQNYLDNGSKVKIVK